MWVRILSVWRSRFDIALPFSILTAASFRRCLLREAYRNTSHEQRFLECIDRDAIPTLDVPGFYALNTELKWNRDVILRSSLQSVRWGIFWKTCSTCAVPFHHCESRQGWTYNVVDALIYGVGSCELHTWRGWRWPWRLMLQACFASNCQASCVDASPPGFRWERHHLIAQDISVGQINRGDGFFIFDISRGWRKRFFGCSQTIRKEYNNSLVAGMPR